MQLQEIHTLVSRAMQNAGASGKQADAVARALVAAQVTLYCAAVGLLAGSAKLRDDRAFGV